MPPDAFAMGNKGNLVLYIDKDLVAKSKSLGFNLSETFENHLRIVILKKGSVAGDITTVHGSNRTIPMKPWTILLFNCFSYR